MIDPVPLALDCIKDHEGFSHTVYNDSLGIATIGYGRNVQHNGITRDEAEHLLTNDVSECVNDLAGLQFWDYLSPTRQAALIDMRYNLGPARFRGFKLMIRALMLEDYSTAASEMLNSRWARQVGRRARKLAHMMKFDEVPA